VPALRLEQDVPHASQDGRDRHRGEVAHQRNRNVYRPSTIAVIKSPAIAQSRMSLSPVHPPDDAPMRLHIPCHHSERHRDRLTTACRGIMGAGSREGKRKRRPLVGSPFLVRAMRKRSVSLAKQT